MMNRLIRHGIYALLVLCLPLSAWAEGVKECYTTTGNQYELTAKIVSLNLSPSAQPGDVIGHVELDNADFTCPSKTDGYAWALQVRPNVSATSVSSTVCETSPPTSGIGVRYYNESGGEVPCNGWSSIITIPAGAQYKTGNIPASQILLEFVRTNDPLPPAGKYTLQIAPIMQAYNAGHTNSSSWGTLTISGNKPIIVSGCEMKPFVTDVPFGKVMKNDTKSLPFSITFSGCINDQDIQAFKEVASLVFSSATMTPQGTIGNCTDSDCAAGNVDISVKDSYDTTLNLNNAYRLDNDLSNNLVYPFVATLTTQNATGGKIEAILNVEVNYI